MKTEMIEGNKLFFKANGFPKVVVVIVPFIYIGLMTFPGLLEAKTVFFKNSFAVFLLMAGSENRF